MRARAELFKCILCPRCIGIFAQKKKYRVLGPFRRQFDLKLMCLKCYENEYSSALTAQIDALYTLFETLHTAALQKCIIYEILIKPLIKLALHSYIDLQADL